MIDKSKMSRLSYIRYMYNMAVEQSEKPYPLSLVSILLFHDCVELFLQLVSEHLNVGKNGYPFLEYWNAVEQKAKYLLTQKDAMKRLNESRSILKHNGIKVDRSEIDVFRVSVANFFDENTHPVFSIHFNSISMASLVHDDDVRQSLETAENLANQQDLTGAIRDVAIAFIQLLSNFESNWLEEHNRLFFRSSILSGLFQSSNLSKFEKEVKDALKELGDKTKIISLGIDYRHYLRFSLITPYVFRALNGEYVSNPVTSITLDEYTFCYNFVIESAFQIQELKLK